MQKQDLKSLLSSLPINTEVDVRFAAESKLVSGRYKFLDTRRGPGKFGSQIGTFLNLSSGDTVTFGTSVSDEVVGITVHQPDGSAELHGSTTEAIETRSFVKDLSAARALRAQFVPLVGTKGARVRVKSKLPELAGDWTVESAQHVAGRYGQTRLDLTDKNRSVSLWSYRHATAVTSFEVLEAGNEI